MDIKNNDNNMYVPKKLATAYVIPQIGDDTFEPMESLKNGTIYPELYMPYIQWRYRNEQK